MIHTFQKLETNKETLGTKMRTFSKGLPKGSRAPSPGHNWMGSGLYCILFRALGAPSLKFVKTSMGISLTIGITTGKMHFF